LHPSAQHVKPRGPLDPKYVENLATELAAFDDSLVMLGGVGDPVAHPDFCAIVHAMRESNVYGIAVQTTGQMLGDEQIAAIIENRVDVVAFTLDAWTPECYAEINRGGDLARATSAIDRLIKSRVEAKQAAPVIVPSLTKSTLNLHEVDAFFDGWIRKVGCAMLGTFSDYGGNLEDLAVSDMQPPDRAPCRRLTNRCYVTADGSVLACDQDLQAAAPLGHLGEQTLGEIWAGKRRSQLRSDHESGSFKAIEICAGCRQWHCP
ncbi:MAG: radical SAM protein, partial [Planctomycetes bacterium]|nr:radical SAM protein [Planctomycetota bacterium]